MSPSESNNGAKKKKPISHTLLAGGTSGFVESSICHPLDTIKTRMQLRDGYIVSVGTRLKHSLVEPAVLHLRHSLVEPILRLKNSFSEPSIVTAANQRMKHSLVEPANLVKLRRHSCAEPSLINAAKTSSTRSVGNAQVNFAPSYNTNTPSSTSASTTKPSSTIFTPTRKYNAELCWWNQPRHHSAISNNTPTRSFQTQAVVNSASTSNAVQRNTISVEFSSTTLAGRGQSSKSYTWWHPMNRGQLTYATITTKSIKNAATLGPIKTAQKIIRKEGFWSLYKGLTAVYVGIIPKMAIRFVSFEHYRDVLKMRTPLGDDATNFTSGLLCGLTEAIVIVTPAEVLKIRMQSQRHSMLDPIEVKGRKYGNVVQTAATVIREEGPSAVYKGIVPTMLRQGCNQAVNFAAYNAMKNYWLERQREQFSLQHDGSLKRDDVSLEESQQTHQHQLSSTMSLLIGGVSGGLGPLVNNPLDVVKTRLQKQNITKYDTPKYTGLIQACFKIANEEGMGALWKGITPRLMRIVPGQAITFTTYEAVCRWL